MIVGAIAGIVVVTLFMLYMMVAVNDLSQRITAVGVAMMIISGILQQHEQHEEANEPTGKIV